MLDEFDLTAIKDVARSEAIVGLLILEARESYLNAYEEYRIRINNGSSAPIHYVKARLERLFLMIRAMYKRTDQNKYQQLLLYVYSDDINLIQKGFLLVDDFLDQKNITRVDLKKSTSGLSAMERNKINTQQ